MTYLMLRFAKIDGWAILLPQGGEEEEEEEESKEREEEEEAETKEEKVREKEYVPACANKYL